MKKYFVSLALMAGMLVGYSQSAGAQRLYVNVRPEAPRVVVERPPRPSVAHVWIGDEWSMRNGSYVHVGGHWEAPPAHRRAWVAGHWEHGSRGHYWVAGHWR
jgi:hypothetical protein